MAIPSFNVKGPKSVGKVFTVTEMYNDYISDKIKESPYHITKKVYRDLLFEYYRTVFTDILIKGFAFKLPCNFGFIYLNKSRPNPNFKPIDWVNTKLLGKYIYLENQHSNEFIYKVVYKLTASTMYPLKAFAFRLARWNARNMAKEIRQGKIDTVNTYNR